MANKPNFLKCNFFFDGEQDYHDKGEWCLSEQVDEYVTHVSKLVAAVEKYGFPDGTEVGDSIADALEDLRQWTKGEE